MQCSGREFDADETQKARVLELLEHGCQGDNLSKHELYEFIHVKLSPWMVRQLRRKAVLPQEVEDSCQEIAVRFMEHLEELRSITIPGLMAYLYRTLQSVARDTRRRRKFVSLVEVPELFSRESPAETVVEVNELVAYMTKLPPRWSEVRIPVQSIH